MALQREIWEGELLQRLRNVDEGHLTPIPDYSSRVVISPMGAATIHLVDIGVDPAIIINNAAYPIAGAARTDRDVPLSLDKVETENTLVTDDELEALPYDKNNSVLNQHQGTLSEGIVEIGTHRLAPDADTATTPIVPTSGAADLTNPLLKAMTIADITSLQLKFNELRIPQRDRVLVLDPKHVRDIALADEAFRDQYHVIQSGRPVDMYGFRIYMYTANPFFQGDVLANYAKQAYGTVYNNGIGAAAVRHRHASIAYYAPRMFKAMTTPKMYLDRAENNPQFRRSEVGFRMYFVAQSKLPQSLAAVDKSPHCIGAIVAADA